MYVVDYAKVLKLAKKDDFVYLDPPYDESNTQNNIARYTVHMKNYNGNFQLELKNYVDELTSKDVYVMESNSCTRTIKKLYKKYTVISTHQKRNLSNEIPSRQLLTERTKVLNECLIRNFK